jgi:hypothetical protein
MGSCESGHQGLEQETSHQGRQRGPTALYRFSLCFTADYGDAGTGPAEDRLPSLRASLSASAQLRLLPIADDEDSLRLFDFNTSLSQSALQIAIDVARPPMLLKRLKVLVLTRTVVWIDDAN